MNEREIFLSAIEFTDLTARQVYLDEACRGNSSLRTQVELLLHSHDSAGQFLRTPAVAQMVEGQPDGSEGTQFLGLSSTFGEEFEPGSHPDATFDTPFGPQSPVDDKDDEDDPLEFLTPSTKPGSIGRLSHYEVVEVLGKGAFGTVLKAFDEVLHRMVAIKLMSTQIAATSPARKRFLREARASAAVRHENIVNIYSVDEQPIPHLVMEYIPGVTLQQRLEARGPLETEEVLRLGRQIAIGLAAAHARGLIHRDIKPANILLESGPEERVKITDFGLARAVDDASLTQSGLIAGTPMYMAPEQVHGKQIDQRADLFSFGSVLYQMLSGRPPFRAPSTIAVLKRVAEDAPRPIPEIIPEAPTWLCEIISRLHAKEPQDRHQSASEVADLLGHCLQEYQHGRVPVFASRMPAGTVAPKTQPELDPPSIAPIVADRAVQGRPVRADANTGKFVWVAFAACCLVLLAGIIVKITNKDGSVTRMEFPAGTKVQVETTADQPDGRIPAAAAHPEEVPQSPAAPPKAIAPFDGAQAKAHQAAWAKHLGVPVEYVNGVGMKFQLIPPGEYLQGSTAAEVEEALKSVGEDPNWRAGVQSEAPQHRVSLTTPFYLSAHEVTQQTYTRVIGSNPSYFSPTGEGKQYVEGRSMEQCPVEFVNWYQANEFCDQLTQLELETYANVKAQAANVTYRLPTEAEWEFACRAGTTTRYWSGDSDASVAEVSALKTESGTRPVGEKRPNAFGLHDMHGNVFEWVQDAWTPASYAAFDGKTAVDPVNSLPNSGLRTFRGGTWIYSAPLARSAIRYFDPPQMRRGVTGIRVALTVEAVRRQLKAGKPAVVAGSQFPALDPDWLKRVQQLPPADQVQEVATEIKRRNPNWGGKILHEVNGGQVTHVEIHTDQLTDIMPMQVFTDLRTFWCSGDDQCQLADLSPLRGLTRLIGLTCNKTKVSDLSPLSGMNLIELQCGHSPVADLSPLKGMQLQRLYCDGTLVSDLTPLKGMPLTDLTIEGTKVVDLSPVKDVPLKLLRFDHRGARDNATLRSIKTLETINNLPVAEFWKTQIVSSFPALDAAWESKVRTLPPDEQVKEIAAELKRRNSEFDGTVSMVPVDNVIYRLEVNGDHIVDLTPLQVLTGLRELKCSGTRDGSGILADLSPISALGLKHLECASNRIKNLDPLRSMPLNLLDCSFNPVSDLSALQSLPLESLYFHQTAVPDLSKLKGMRLKTIGFDSTHISDLSALSDMPLTYLSFQSTPVASLEQVSKLPLEFVNCLDSKVKDLTPLRNAPLREIWCDFDAARDKELLGSIKTLTVINAEPAEKRLKP